MSQPSIYFSFHYVVVFLILSHFLLFVDSSLVSTYCLLYGFFLSEKTPLESVPPEEAPRKQAPLGEIPIVEARFVVNLLGKAFLVEATFWSHRKQRSLRP